MDNYAAVVAEVRQLFKELTGHELKTIVSPRSRDQILQPVSDANIEDLIELRTRLRNGDAT